MKLRKSRLNWVYVASFALLILYSLRHVCQGVDLWDGGYNYANFRYSGLEYMDSMWYFATWLANGAGALLRQLPRGDTMLGMNVYTALLTGGIAAVSYDFCVRTVRIPPWLAFAGEIMALSLCWAPAGILYNYMTYAFLLAGTIWLYRGLTEGRDRYLVLAGAALGLNIGVRFSNLAQVGLILAVWYYAFISRKKFAAVVRETGLCMLGYLGAWCGFFLLMALLYGPGDYVKGIMRLFAMTEHASDYRATSMIASMAKAYYDATYWIKRYGIVVAGGAAVCMLLPERWLRIKQIAILLATVFLGWWLWKLGYCYRDYKVYPSIYEPCIVIFEFAVMLSLMLFISRKTEKSRKLLAMLMVLTILLTSLGSNNAVYSSINNGFFVFPCFLGIVYDFFRSREKSIYLPFKGALAVGILLLGFQALPFGISFVYEEASGARDLETEITGIPVLQGMHTGAEKAEKLESLHHYLADSGLIGRKCILYGNIPGIAYYMELPPAIPVWSDLRSYSLEVMKADLALSEQEMSKGGERPLIILESSCALYVDTRDGSGIFEEKITEEKMLLICDFMERNGYNRIFDNEKYVVYE